MILFPGGYSERKGETISPNTYIYDYQGSVRVVLNAQGQIVEQNDYEPFGEIADNIGQQPYKNIGKENMNYMGMDFEDFGARVKSGKRWKQMDPLMEKYYSISPYAYCANNPIRYVDNDGKKIKVSGSCVGQVIIQLNSVANNSVTFGLNSNGEMTYQQNIMGPLTKEVSELVRALDDNSITVNIHTQENHVIEIGGQFYLFVGGAFMGNSFILDDYGNIIGVDANQIVNPEVLGLISNFYGKPGNDMLHEVIEAYYGAILSMRMGFSVTFGGSNYMSIYNRAHSASPAQSGRVGRSPDFEKKINERILDKAIPADWRVTQDGDGNSYIEIFIP